MQYTRTIRVLLTSDDVNGGGSSSSGDGKQVLPDSSTGAEAGKSNGKDGQGNADLGSEAPSLKDVIAGIQAKHAAKLESEGKVNTSAEDPSLSPSDKQAEADAAAGIVPKENETDSEKGKQDVAGKQDDAASKAKVVDDSKLPFGKHPRFKELVAEKNAAQEKVTQLEPVVERMKAIEDYCVKNGIDAQSYDNALILAGLQKTNPQEAIKRLEAQLNELRLNVGEILPSDLQEKVDGGTLALTDAKELAQARLDKERAQGQVKQTEAQQAAQIQQQLVQTLDSWSNQKAKTDLAFKPKANANEADGKYELVQSKFAALWQARTPRTIAEAVALAEEAYTAVDKYVTSIIPRPAVTRRLTPKSSAAPREEQVDTSKPGWARKVGRQVLANR